MLRYVGQRLLWFPVLLLAVSFITFALGFYGPGDPVQQRLGQHATPDAVARLTAELGLDRPFLVQYGDYVARAARGDLGESFPLFPGKPVSALIGRGLWVTVQINLASLLVAVLVGIPVGILAALFRNTILDYLLMAGAVAGLSFPIFALAPIAVWIVAVQLRLVALGWDGLFSAKAIMPVLLLAIGPAAVLARQTRASLIDVLGAEYVRMARAKGLSEWVVISRHAFRNALIPLITLLGLMLGSLVSGAFITETLFGIPGIGKLAVESFFARDYPVIMALTLLIAITYAATSLLVDLLYPLVDPRVRYD